MKLLIITQKVDKNDDLLGFMHGWIKKIANHCNFVTVICLEKGLAELPINTKILSLGKEKRKSRLKYLFNFYRYIWQERKNYDVAFVHMNQEYVLLAGFFWKILGKKIILWRNHPKGNFLTKIAIWLSQKVFCVSPYSYTAKFKKTKIMPAGIDTDFFRKISQIFKKSNSILFFGRISPIKKIEILIEALAILKRKNIKFEAAIYGDYPPADKKYYEFLVKKTEELNLANYIFWHQGVPHWQAPEIYNGFEISVNLTPTGSFDKTILEAMACENLILISNKSFQGQIDPRFRFIEKNPPDLSEKIESIFLLNGTAKSEFGKQLRDYVIKNHSLDYLIERLIDELK